MVSRGTVHTLHKRLRGNHPVFRPEPKRSGTARPIPAVSFHVSRPRNIHFVGVGGKGLAGIAELLATAGWRVSGSDEKDSPVMARLRSAGVDACLGHNGNLLQSAADVVLASAIIASSNPELAAARARGVPVVDRAKFLGELFANFPLKIAVAGSHGKSTTTALVGLALEAAGKMPTVFGGAPVREKEDAHGWLGGDECAVVEACEFRRSFLALPADFTIVTSFEHAHPECYPTIEAMGNSFAEFFSAHNPNATLILDGDAPGLAAIATRARRHAVTVGFGNGVSFRVVAGTAQGTGNSRRETCAIYRSDGSLLGSFATLLPGQHNLKNVAYVAVLLDLLGLPSDPLASVLQTFSGVARRFEARETAGGVILVDDFAHHATQAAHAVAAARERWPERELLVVFEPRQCKMVLKFLAEYGGAFRGAREVIVTEPVPALDDTPEDVAALPWEAVISAVASGSGLKAVGAASFAAASEYATCFIESVGAQRSVIMTVGPGDVHRVSDALVSI